MKKFAQILYNKAHWIFEAEVKPQSSPDILLVEITDFAPQPQEGWDYDGVNFTFPVLYTNLADAQQAKLQELEKCAASAYTAGLQSSASGTALWYDSDTDTQAVINRQYLIALSNPEVYSSTVFFTELSPGITPVRARPSKDSPESSKTIQYLNSDQMIQLGNDLAAAWAKVKAIYWEKVSQVNSATTKEEVELVTWPT